MRKRYILLFILLVFVLIILRPTEEDFLNELDILPEYSHVVTPSCSNYLILSICQLEAKNETGPYYIGLAQHFFRITNSAFD